MGLKFKARLESGVVWSCIIRMSYVTYHAMTSELIKYTAFLFLKKLVQQHRNDREKGRRGVRQDGCYAEQVLSRVPSEWGLFAIFVSQTESSTRGSFSAAELESGRRHQRSASCSKWDHVISREKQSDNDLVSEIRPHAANTAQKSLLPHHTVRVVFP